MTVRTPGSEDGQAMVEFALILFPLLLLISGIIQFGIAINFWLDQQRLAAAGARVAAVNCAQAWCTPTLEQFLEGQTLSNGNQPQATVCFESKTGNSGGMPIADAGDQVTVYLESPFNVVPIFGVGTIMISARTTMRLEQKATNAGIVGAPVCS